MGVFRDIEGLLMILYMVPSTRSSRQSGGISGESKKPNYLKLLQLTMQFLAILNCVAAFKPTFLMQPPILYNPRPNSICLTMPKPHCSQDSKKTKIEDSNLSTLLQHIIELLNISLVWLTYT